MKRSVTEAKLKCRYCQAIFVGSTRLSPEVSSSAETLPTCAPPPDKTSRFHHVPTRRRSVWPAAIVLIGLAGAAVLGTWLFHNFQREQADVPETEPAPIVSTMPSAPAESVATPSPDDKPAPAPAPQNTEENSKKAPPVEVIECARLAGPAEASATFVGTYENHSPQVLRWVRVVVTVSRANGEKLRASSIQYENIPPGWRGRFSADATFRFEPGMRIAGFEAQAAPDPKRQGWALKGWIREVTDEDTIHLTGETKNTTNQPLADPVVWCDFFTKQGVYVGSVSGTFRRNTRTLAPGASAAYDIRFDPKDAGSSSRLLADPQPRLLGTTTNP